METKIDFSKYVDNTAVLLVSHGSSLPYAKNTFDSICKKFVEATGLNTEVGYMKVAEPLIPEAINLLKEATPNLKRIIALPVFLAAGIHTNIDIPTILGIGAKEVDPRQPDGVYPEDHYLHGLKDIDFDGELEYIGPIGPNPRLLEIIDKKIENALNKSKLKDAKTGVLLVSHGSRLNYNKEFISTLHKLFAKKSKYPSDFGFMELVEPNIPTSINKLVNENDIDRLIVVPVFLAPGVHTTRDIPTILGLIEDDGKEHHHHHHNHDHTHTHEHNHSHNHEHHHHHGHGDEKMEFDGEVLYPEPICDDDILIEILEQMVFDVLK